jgi:hypothetical protein
MRASTHEGRRTDQALHLSILAISFLLVITLIYRATRRHLEARSAWQ